MNIRNRIKKIELETKAFSEHCECRETPKFEIVYHEDGKPATSPGLLQNVREPVPDFCANCEKPIKKNVLIVDFTSSIVPEPESAKEKIR